MSAEMRDSRLMFKFSSVTVTRQDPLRTAILISSYRSSVNRLTPQQTFDVHRFIVERNANATDDIGSKRRLLLCVYVWDPRVCVSDGSESVLRPLERGVTWHIRCTVTTSMRCSTIHTISLATCEQRLYGSPTSKMSFQRALSCIKYDYIGLLDNTFTRMLNL